MRQIQGTIEGPFSVEEDSALHGIITVGAIVREGVTFHVHGMITGDLTVEAGAKAVVHGMVNGTILNCGQVVIYGSIDALVDSGPQSRSVVDPEALIRNRH